MEGRKKIIPYKKLIHLKMNKSVLISENNSIIKDIYRFNANNRRLNKVRLLQINVN